MPGPAATRRPSRRRATAADGASSAPAATPAESPYAARPWLASYPPGVPADVDVPDIPLTRLLDDAASSFPTSTALAFLGTKISYKELKDAVDRFATALAGLGVKKGDRVAVVLPNCPQNVIATYAALRLGAVVVQHNPLYTEAELRHQLADCGATVVVCLDRVYEAVARVRRDTALQHVVVTSIADYLPTAAKLKLRLPVKKAKRARAEILAPLPKGAPVHHFVALLKGAGLPSRQVALEPATDLALLQYTGGTTGASKGAMLTHRNLVSNAYMNRYWDTEAKPGREVCLAVLPLFHAYGLTVCMNATLLLGGTLVLLPRFDLEQVFEAIDTWKPTMLPGVPPIYKALSDSPAARSHDLRSIRVCISGAMKLPTEVQVQFERISGARLVEGYGMTETSPSTHCNPLVGTRRAGSIGLPLPGTHAKVVDQDDPTREVPVGAPGELAIKGPQVFAGYWGKDDLSGVFTDDGYVLTGDIAVMAEDGFFSIVDRKKELIIAGGFNIYPSEVEEVLFRLPGVQDAVVVGVPDRYRGETVKAFVVRAPGAQLTEDDVVSHCATELTAYKVPKLVEFRSELPRTVVGKVLRRVLLEQERAKAAAAQEERPASVPGGTRRGGASAPGSAEQEAVTTATETQDAAKGAAATGSGPRRAGRSSTRAAADAPAQAPARAPRKATGATRATGATKGRRAASDEATTAGGSTPGTQPAPPAPARTRKATGARPPATRSRATPAPASADPDPGQSVPVSPAAEPGGSGSAAASPTPRKAPRRTSAKAAGTTPGRASAAKRAPAPAEPRLDAPPAPATGGRTVPPASVRTGVTPSAGPRKAGRKPSGG